MQNISYKQAALLLEQREKHLQWVEKMQMQGDLALIAGDFAAYAQNMKRLLSVPVSKSSELQGADILQLNAASVTLPPVTSVSCYESKAPELIEAAYTHGCARALPFMRLHGKSPFGNTTANAGKGMTDIDSLLEKGGEECWSAANANESQPDYMALKGICYMRGLGVAQNDEKAIKCFLSVAKQSALAQFGIGMCYEEGRGLSQDRAMAGKWYYQAANNGCWQAAQALLYRNDNAFGKEGKALQETDAYKKQWLPVITKHAENGNSLAQNMLGYMYETGKGVTQNKAEAARWYRKAAEQGHEQAKERLQKL